MATPTRVFAPGPKDVVVKIGLDPKGNITVSPDPFWVSKGKEPQVNVMWVCTVDHQHGTGGSPCFTVDFNKEGGSPFNDWHFCGHGASSGLVRLDVKPCPSDKPSYKYTVNMNGKSYDPGGGVTP